MKNQTFWRCVSLGLGWMWMGFFAIAGVRADNGSQHRPVVRVSVYNDAGLTPGTLWHAEEEAAVVFRKAGIETEWKDCGVVAVVAEEGSPCGEAAYPARVVLRVRWRARGMTDEPLGVAYLSEHGEGAYCHVFLEPMEELQQTYAVSLEMVLGHVAAHEIAHLLLGLRSHSAAGVMRAHWNLQTIEEMKRGNLGFNATQSAAMVERLEFARKGAPDDLVTMAVNAPVTLMDLPAQCRKAH